MPKRKQDNSTFEHKVKIRQEGLKRFSEMGVSFPVVMETHGGFGVLFDSCYAHLQGGVVFDKDTEKADRLGLQRPTWAVYEADSAEALRGGAGGHVAVDLLDVDPYGEPWPVIDAFFSSQRQFAETMMVVVNDGLRQSLSLGKAWTIHSLSKMVRTFGNDLHPIYLDVCKVMMADLAAKAGYCVEHFGGYYCGIHQANTHYLAVLAKG